jgi:DNA (cytosine-5)-methyltransferase 1
VKVAVVDFFSGAGGTSVGFRNAGMSIVAGIDNDADAAATYRANFPEARFFERDIREISGVEIAAVIPPNHATLFSGCAPCQPFSKQNRSRHDSDPRRFLLSEFQRFVTELLPDFVVVENVPGMQKVGKGGPLDDFIKALKKSGYSVDCGILSAANYGVPQRRRRLVLMAAKGMPIQLPAATHGEGLLKFSTVRDWAAGLPPISAGETDPNDPDHAAMALSPLNLKRILATAEGKGRESWGEDLLLTCHQEHAGHSDVYGRLAWDKPAAAMTTRCLSYSNGRYGHPEEARAISLREAACLQTFPRDFKFSGLITSKGRQVGNAVPPLLAQRIAEKILKSAADPTDGLEATLF